MKTYKNCILYLYACAAPDDPEPDDAAAYARFAEAPGGGAVDVDMAIETGGDPIALAGRLEAACGTADAPRAKLLPRYDLTDVRRPGGSPFLSIAPDGAVDAAVFLSDEAFAGALAALWLMARALKD